MSLPDQDLKWLHNIYTTQLSTHELLLSKCRTPARLEGLDMQTAREESLLTSTDNFVFAIFDLPDISSLNRKGSYPDHPLIPLDQIHALELKIALYFDDVYELSR